MKVSHNNNAIKNTNMGSFIPNYSCHFSDNVIYLKDGKLMATLKLEGFPFESIEDDEIFQMFERFRTFFVALAKSEDIFIWTHLLKKRGFLENNYKIDNVFLQEFYNFYIDNLQATDFYTTHYIMSIGIPVVSSKNEADLEASLEKMNEILSQIKTALSPFDLTLLGVENGISEVSKYLGFLINHKDYDLPLSSTEISKSITNSDVFFGFDVTQIKNFEDEKDIFASNYILKDLPRTTEIGQLDFLLKMPYEFVLTTSFLPFSVNKGIKELDKQMNKLNSVKSADVDKVEIEMGRDFLQTGENILGSLHSVLTVFGNTPKEAKENGIKVSGEFLTSGKGFRYVKATYDAPMAYFSHLPLAKNRPLPTMRTLSLLGCMFSLHNYSYGKKEGNPIGDGSAIMPLKSVNDSIYYFNTHYSEPHRNVLGQKIAGHALILGATGTGKTTFEGASAGFLQRFNPSLFVIDFNCSTELFVRAFGGQYFELKEGEYTGLNPFQIGDSNDKELVSFLKSWVKRCASREDGTPVTDHEAIEIDNAVDSVMGLPREARRFSMLLQSILPSSDLGVRLKKWCNDGALSWALDSPQNEFNPEEIEKIGFDTTVILEQINGKDHPACEPILSVLFFYKNRIQKDGRLMLTIVEEFWKPANFPLTQEMIKASLRAGRMKGEMIWLTSQAPEDAVNCGIFTEIVNQTSTKICLPNPSASYEGYKKIGLTEKEFRLLKSLDRDSRTMLIKQSNSSVFAKMDLYGFDDFLPIFSGTKAGTLLAKRIINEIGSDDPNLWIPIFLEKIKESKNF